MRPTGKRSNIRIVLGFTLLWVACGMISSGVRPVRALDVFTLWRQRELPLRMTEGAWVDYRTQVMAGGRRDEGLTRIVCLDREGGSDDETLLVELLPLDELPDGSLVPVPGEGARLRLSRTLLAREGHLLDAVVSAEKWLDGIPEKISREQLRNDPLVSASLDTEFTPDHTERKDPTTRVIAGTQYLCDQLIMTAADTQSADLPAGRMIQTTTREITAAIHEEIPFLGLAFAAERVRSESRLDPPSRKFSAPAPQVRVEVMELLGFGYQAKPVLGPRH
ncbi:MAG: hypothetical protein ABFS42_03115 [Candidatus Krumholzibacteriota bacterium]